MADLSAPCLVGRSHHSLCHPAGCKFISHFGSADRKTGAAIFHYLYTLHDEVYSDIYSRLFLRHRYLLFPEKKLQKRKGAWLRQMGRCSADLQALQGEAVHPESVINPELPYGFGWI